MIEVRFDFTLPGPIEKVFSYLCNPNNDSQWQRACASASTLNGQAPALNTQYQICFKLLGKEMHFLARITSYEPFSSYAFEVIEGSFHYQGKYCFSEEVDTETQSSHTRVQWFFAAEPGKFFGILPPALLRKVLLSQVEEDTRRLQTVWNNNSFK